MGLLKRLADKAEHALLGSPEEQDLTVEGVKALRDMRRAEVREQRAKRK